MPGLSANGDSVSGMKEGLIMLIEDIREVYRQALTESAFCDFPERITMSDITLAKLKFEVSSFVCIKGFPEPESVYGMKIICDNRLPAGLFVIGGLIGPKIGK